MSSGHDVLVTIWAFNGAGEKIAKVCVGQSWSSGPGTMERSGLTFSNAFGVAGLDRSAMRAEALLVAPMLLGDMPDFGPDIFEGRRGPIVRVETHIEVYTESGQHVTLVTSTGKPIALEFRHGYRLPWDSALDLDAMIAHYKIVDPPDGVFSPYMSVNEHKRAWSHLYAYAHALWGQFGMNAAFFAIRGWNIPNTPSADKDEHNKAHALLEATRVA